MNASTGQRVGLWLGAALFAMTLLLPAPAGLPPEGWRVAGVALLMATWWFTEPVPIGVTAALPFLLFPPLGVMPAAEAAAAYWSPIIMLVLGGALVALAVEKSGLHRRLALAIARRGGASPRSLLLAFMAATAIVSMGVSNTATALIMMPVGLALAAAARDALGDATEGFTVALVLGVAYAASIGGLGTLVGSPTNAIAAGLINRTLGTEIDFLSWLAFGIPIVVVAVPLAALILARLHRVGAAAIDRTAVLAAIGEGGRWSPFERRLVPPLLLLLAGWIALPPVRDALPEASPLRAVEDGIVALGVGLLLFLLPRGDRREGGQGGPMLEAADLRAAPWDVLFLFGGGLALAAGITDSGLAAWMGVQLKGLGGLPVWLLAALVVALVIVVTEFASNVATASGFIPVVAGLALAIGADPALLAVPAALASSWGFMMPAGTGPNAIAYATGRVSVAQMVRAGFLVNLMGLPLLVGIPFLVAALAA